MHFNTIAQEELNFMHGLMPSEQVHSRSHDAGDRNVSMLPKAIVLVLYATLQRSFKRISALRLFSVAAAKKTILDKRA